jgi:ATP dependent DNA ligase domain
VVNSVENDQGRSSAYVRNTPTHGAYDSFLVSTVFCFPLAKAQLHTLVVIRRARDARRIIARKNGERVRLYSRPGNDFTRRFPLIVDALVRLRSRSCIIDGEAVACDDNGVASFRHHRHNDRVFLYAFDLIELNGERPSCVSPTPQLKRE